jgi:nicotinate-nucleotide adenylyltransferase
MRIGLMGGTFDPIHNGHLVAADEVRFAFELDRVLFVPAGDPWQKSSAHVTPSSQRLEMTEIAIADNDAFGISTVDIDRGGPTYTIDTLRDVAAQQPESELFFITGADAMLEILTWKEPELVLSLATFVAVTRPGYDLARVTSLGLPEEVAVLEIPALAISSTDIRARAAAGRPIRYLVPDAVAGYIHGEALYRG